MTAHDVPARPGQATDTLVERTHRATKIFFIALAFALAGGAALLLPHVVERQHAAEIARLQEIVQINRMLCEKWGLKSGTPDHTACTIDLDEVRARQVRDMTARMMGVI